MFIISRSQPNPAYLFHTYFAIEKQITIRYTAIIVSITLFLSQAKWKCLHVGPYTKEVVST